jgi:hypothetical protein
MEACRKEQKRAMQAFKGLKRSVSFTGFTGAFFVKGG